MTTLPPTDLARLAELTRTLIRFPSPQTELFEREPQVRAFLDGPVRDALAARGLPVRRDAMGGAIAEIVGEEPGPSVLIVGYAMTHPPARMEAPFAADLVDGGARIRGRGAAEQKGALAAAIEATAAAQGRLRCGRLALGVTAAGETGRHDAAEALLAALPEPPDVAIVAIGTGCRLALGNKGRIDVDVAIHGRAAHSSTPEAGVDAIAGARKALDRILSLDVGERTHPGLGRATLTATAIRSWPEATHTVQDEVRMTFDRRLLPGDDAESAFEAIARAADIGPPWRVEVRRGPYMRPAEIPEDGALARAADEGRRRRGLPAPERFHASFALDAGLFAERGAEAAMWGPGDPGLWHGDAESVGLEELREASEGYRGLIETLLT